MARNLGSARDPAAAIAKADEGREKGAQAAHALGGSGEDGGGNPSAEGEQEEGKTTDQSTEGAAPDTSHAEQGPRRAKWPKLLAPDERQGYQIYEEKMDQPGALDVMGKKEKGRKEWVYKVRYYLHKPEEPGTWVAVMECKNTRVHLSESELTVWVENYQESEAEQALQDLKGRKRKPTQLEIDSPEKAQRRASNSKKARKNPRGDPLGEDEHEDEEETYGDAGKRKPSSSASAMDGQSLKQAAERTAGEILQGSARGGGSETDCRLQSPSGVKHDVLAYVQRTLQGSTLSKKEMVRAKLIKDKFPSIMGSETALLNTFARTCSDHVVSLLTTNFSERGIREQARGCMSELAYLEEVVKSIQLSVGKQAEQPFSPTASIKTEGSVCSGAPSSTLTRGRTATERPGKDTLFCVGMRAVLMLSHTHSFESGEVMLTLMRLKLPDLDKGMKGQVQDLCLSDKNDVEYALAFENMKTEADKLTRRRAAVAVLKLLKNPASSKGPEEAVKAFKGIKHKHIQGNGKVEKEIRQWAVFKEAKVVRSKLWGAWKKGMLFGDKASCHFHTLRETVVRWVYDSLQTFSADEMAAWEGQTDLVRAMDKRVETELDVDYFVKAANELWHAEIKKLLIMKIVPSFFRSDFVEAEAEEEELEEIKSLLEMGVSSPIDWLEYKMCLLTDNSFDPTDSARPFAAGMKAAFSCAMEKALADVDVSELRAGRVPDCPLDKKPLHKKASALLGAGEQSSGSTDKDMEKTKTFVDIEEAYIEAWCASPWLADYNFLGWGQGEEAVNEFMDQWCTGFSIKEHIEQPIIDMTEED